MDVFVKEREESCWVPRYLSRLEVRRLRALWMDRKNCVTGWRREERCHLQGSSCQIMEETGCKKTRDSVGGAQDPVPFVSRVTSGMKRKRPR